MRFRGLVRVVACALPLLGARTSLAQTAPSAAAPGAKAEMVGLLREDITRIPAGRGQTGLGLSKRHGSLLAAVCADECDWSNALEFPVSPGVWPALHAVQTQSLKLEGGRLALHVQVPVGERSWQAVIAAPLAKPQGTEKPVAQLVFAGFVGLQAPVAAEPGAVAPVVAEPGVQALAPAEPRSGQSLQIYDKPNGTKEIVVGELSEALQICGRPSLLSPKVFHAQELKLRAIRFQRLSAAELKAAQPLSAEPNSNPKVEPLLQVVGASTGADQVAALTDGDPATFWSEKRGGDGGGEFLVFRLPQAAPLSAVHLQVRPTANVPAAGAAPGKLWLATDGGLFQVSLPPGAWQTPEHVVYTLRLPAPVTTSCLALVLDQAANASPVKAPQGVTPAKAKASAEAKALDVTLAEVSVETTLTPLDVAAAVRQLAAVDAQAQPAFELLQALGPAAYSALYAGVAALPPLAQVRALQLLERAPCKSVAASYAQAFTRGFADASEPLFTAATEGVRRCGSVALPALVLQVQTAKSPLTRAVFELALALDPKLALNAAVPLLAQSGPVKRRVLREVIAEASAQPEALEAARVWLQNPALGRVAQIDLLRAVTPEAAPLRAAAMERTLQLLSSEPSFRTRYLLLQPLARLAPLETRAAGALARLAETDPKPAVRTEAVRVAPALPALGSSVLAALEDPHVRVREAAVTAAGKQQLAEARPMLERRLEDDAWPVVRAASVRALRELPAQPATTQRLAEAAESDDSSEVRRPALIALGALQAHAHLEAIRERFNEDEDPYVQAAAASALGQLCDQRSLDALTQQAIKLARFGASERDGIVATASLGALGQLRPKDLKARLAPFFRPEVPIFVQGAARMAFDHPQPCSR